jgi:hypothetical protein
VPTFPSEGLKTTRVPIGNGLPSSNVILPSTATTGFSVLEEHPITNNAKTNNILIICISFMKKGVERSSLLP